MNFSNGGGVRLLTNLDTNRPYVKLQLYPVNHNLKYEILIISSLYIYKVLHFKINFYLPF